ncbi:substrate-binding periplasmic protein [Stutzerimonas azotifigens]|uniref:ABC transporter substrate-binding protein n=1 Tax=Stutzerimonas azotifigens TaxID=291995 RepID=A0ABR5Z1Y3_9GAMM|nr:ABC transporter substrate-binding protein [Stutzerimonas azotifigens]MBA1274162.1 ABC transporter substrate-binding protein [Stutzerimonas azotifigens]
MLNKIITHAMLSLLPLIAVTAQAADVVQVLTQNYPPFSMSANDKNFEREDGIEGIDKEVVVEMFKRAEVPYQMTLRFPWSRLQEMAEQQSGFAVYSLSRTAQRESRYKWVGPLSEIQLVLLKKPGNPIVLHSLDDARKYSIGSVDGTSVSQYLAKRNFDVKNVLSGAPTKLQAGEFDLWATTNPAGQYESSKAGVGRLEVAFSISSTQLYLAMNKETPDEVVQKLQSTLDQMRKEGFIDQVTARYLND